MQLPKSLGSRKAQRPCRKARRSGAIIHIESASDYRQADNKRTGACGLSHGASASREWYDGMPRLSPQDKNHSQTWTEPFLLP